MDRRLGAILVADVVGYSRLMGADEASALSALSALRGQTVDPCVAAHAGKVVKRMGDGWLIEFASALDAVSCAIAIQNDIVTHHEISLRIGVHLGDIIHDDENDIHGDGVNIATRLEGIAAPGGIAISDQVYNVLDGTQTPLFADGGERALKNIARKVRVWNWTGGAAGAVASIDSEGDDTPVIVLEPFTLGGDAEAAADLSLDVQSGLQDALAHRTGIRVATGTSEGVPASYRLHGRCRVSGNRCRLHLSITRAATSETCWSTKIDGDIGDGFAFVDDVVWKVSAAIRIQINAFAGAALADVPDADLTVQQLMSKAAYLLHQFETATMESARQTLEQAYARQPENPMVLSMYSYALMQFVPLAMQRLGDIDVARIMSLADKAVQFGSRVDYAFHNRARIRLWLRRDHQGCIQDSRRALAINPGFHFAVEDIALAQIFGDDPGAGVVSLERLVQEFPTHPTTACRLSILALGYIALGDAERALAHAEDAHERKPAIRLHAIVYAAAASAVGDHTGRPAFGDMIRRLDLRTGDADRFPFASDERTKELVAAMRRAGVPD